MIPKKMATRMMVQEKPQLFLNNNNDPVIND